MSSQLTSYSLQLESYYVKKISIREQLFIRQSPCGNHQKFYSNTVCFKISNILVVSCIFPYLIWNTISIPLTKSSSTWTLLGYHYLICITSILLLILCQIRSIMNLNFNFDFKFQQVGQCKHSVGGVVKSSVQLSSPPRPQRNAINLAILAPSYFFAFYMLTLALLMVSHHFVVVTAVVVIIVIANTFCVAHVFVSGERWARMRTKCEMWLLWRVCVY